MLVQDGVYDAFVKKLTERVASLVVGNGAADGVHLGPLINGGGLAKVERLVADAVSKVGWRPWLSLLLSVVDVAVAGCWWLSMRMQR